MADEDPQYTRWLRKQSCCSCSKPAPSVVHHHTQRRAKGRRAHDHDGMPLCHRCHFELHGLCGLFKAWKRADLRAFQDAMVNRYRAQYVPPKEEETCETETIF